MQGLRQGVVSPNTENVGRACRLADRQVARLGRLADELLDAGRIEADRLRIELGEVDLAEVVREGAAAFAANLAQAGSTLELRAPAVRRAAPRGRGARTPAESEAHRMSAAPGAVLVVGDDRDVLEAFGLVLTSAGHQVVTVRNGEEALDLPRTRTPLPAVVFLDLMMPVMDGWQFREEQREDPRLARVPTIRQVWSRELSIRFRAAALRLIPCAT